MCLVFDYAALSGPDLFASISSSANPQVDVPSSGHRQCQMFVLVSRVKISSTMESDGSRSGHPTATHWLLAGSTAGPCGPFMDDSQHGQLVVMPEELKVESNRPRFRTDS